MWGLDRLQPLMEVLPGFLEPLMSAEIQVTEFSLVIHLGDQPQCLHFSVALTIADLLGEVVNLGVQDGLGWKNIKDYSGCSKPWTLPEIGQPQLLWSVFPVSVGTTGKAEKDLVIQKE